jgi:hypothetical protein
VKVILVPAHTLLVLAEIVAEGVTGEEIIIFTFVEVAVDEVAQAKLVVITHHTESLLPKAVLV